ncbi:metallophosphoesterase [Pseudomonas fulva]|uniref:metallophosphoesterase n=1 Tax=Pseudomonas fulva TaxID=47880 RepID=UPI00201DD551|nr:metallophosphoesterase [Pseudomonas fulva]UQY32990.1 metallophosphoesterase [Pseudomonas fulva]
MKLYVLSDLHNEFSRFDAAHPEHDLVILAGDIDIKCRGVKWASEVFTKPVAYICGNHEFYGGHFDRTLAKMRECAAPNVWILENDALVFDGLRILGATGWTDFTISGDVSAASRQARHEMNDYRCIRADSTFRRLRPDDTAKRNRVTEAWLDAELSKPFPGSTLVVTHHCPLVAAIAGMEEGHAAASYSNNWPELVSRADGWIYGHTHQAIDQKFHGCRVISNPRGYPSEPTGFDPAFVIEI